MPKVQELLASQDVFGQHVPVPLFRRKRDDSVDPEGRSPQLGVKYKDLAVLDQLMKAGADLDQPRHVLHYLYFPSAGAATAAAEAVRTTGFDAEVRPPMDQWPNQWSLVCEKHGVITDPVSVRDTGNYFDEVAQQHGGEYDGWEASV